MRGSLSKIKTHPLLPAIALMASVFLLTGQAFNCCHINGAIGGKITAALSHWSSSGSDNAPLHHEEESGHAHCHGHAMQAGTADAGAGIQKDFDSGSALNQYGTCLSERIETGKPMLAGDFTFSPIPTLIAAIVEESAPSPSVRPVSPRLQNKSSPPLYLTTLRILV